MGWRKQGAAFLAGGASVLAYAPFELFPVAAVSLGVAGVFIETHEDPDRAPSDGPNMIPLAAMPELLASLMAFDRLAKADPLRP